MAEVENDSTDEDRTHSTSGPVPPGLDASLGKLVGANANVAGLSAAAAKIMKSNSSYLSHIDSLTKMMKIDPKTYGLSASVANMVKANPKAFGLGSNFTNLLNIDSKTYGLSAAVAKMVKTEPSIFAMNASFANIVKSEPDAFGLLRGMEAAGLTNTWAKTMKSAGFNASLSRLVASNYNALGLTASVAKVMEGNPGMLGLNGGLAKVVAGNPNISGLSDSITKMMAENPKTFGLKASLSQVVKVDPKLVDLNVNLAKMMEPSLAARDILATVRRLESLAAEEFGADIEPIFEATAALRSGTNPDSEDEMVDLDFTDPKNRQLFAIFIAVYLGCFLMESQLIHPEFWNFAGKLDKAAGVAYVAYRLLIPEANEQVTRRPGARSWLIRELIRDAATANSTLAVHLNFWHELG